MCDICGEGKIAADGVTYKDPAKGYAETRCVDVERYCAAQECEGCPEIQQYMTTQTECCVRQATAAPSAAPSAASAGPVLAIVETHSSASAATAVLLVPVAVAAVTAAMVAVGVLA